MKSQGENSNSNNMFKNLLTQKQKEWLVRRTINEKDFYPFPSIGFNVYSEPNFLGGIKIDTNPLTKSLAGEYFLVKEKVNGFCKGNFYHRPTRVDMYIREEELSRRGLTEMFLLLMITFIPLVIYNQFHQKLNSVGKSSKR